MSHLVPELEELGRRLEEGIARPRRHRLLARLPRPLALAPTLAAIGLALVVGALLVVGRSEPKPAPRPAATPPPGSEAEARALLGVLRRPQTTGERRVAARHRMSSMEAATVRLVHGGSAGGRAFFYLTAGFPPRPGSTRSGPIGVCLYRSAGAFCTTARMLQHPSVLGSMGRRRLLGLVPDGVATVELGVGAQSVGVPVHDNYWEADVPPGEGARSINVIWKDSGGRTIPAPAPTAAPTPSSRPDLHRPIAVLGGDRIRFTPVADRHRYDVVLECERGGAFDAGLTRRLPAGRPFTIRLRGLHPLGPFCHGNVLEGTVTDVDGLAVLGRFTLRR
jgi:hypothetical protein